MPYSNCKITGPYSRKKMRNYLFVDITFPDGKRVSKSYARYLLETLLGRILSKKEHVAYKDGDRNNTSLENLTLTTKKAARRLQIQKFTCPMCGEVFTLTGNQQANAVSASKRREGYSGPYCSLSCKGKYASRVSHHGVTNKRQRYTNQYTTKQPMEQAVVQGERS